MKLGEFELDKIYNEDCYEAIKRIPDKSVDLVITDPPYQFVQGGSDRKDKSKKEIYSLDTNNTKKQLSNGYSCGGGCFGTKKRNYHSELNETDVTLDRNNTQFISTGFTNDLLDEFVRVMKKINIYIWCNKNQLRQIIDYFDDKGCFIDLLTWHKTNPIPTCNGTYLSDTEYCVFARESGVGLYGTYETKRKWYVSECNKADKDLFDHPTIKPINIIKNLIINSSNENDIILDTFMGSGTTACACKELNRHFISFELNPKFCEIANDRLKGITKDDREKQKQGQITLF